MQQPWAQRLLVGTWLPPGLSRGLEAAAAGEGEAAAGSRLRAPRPGLSSPEAGAEPRGTRDTACPVRRPRGARLTLNRRLQAEEPGGSRAGLQGRVVRAAGARRRLEPREAAWAAEGQRGGARTEQVLSTGCLNHKVRKGVFRPGGGEAQEGLVRDGRGRRAQEGWPTPSRVHGGAGSLRVLC